MTITVYSTTTCPYCVMLKKWLTSNKIDFTDIYIDRDKDAARTMVELSGQMGVPFTTVEDSSGTIHGVLGYDTATLKHLLDTVI